MGGSIFAHGSDLSYCGVCTVLAKNSAGEAVPTRRKEIPGHDGKWLSAFLPSNPFAAAPELHHASAKRRYSDTNAFPYATLPILLAKRGASRHTNEHWPTHVACES
jgi:hypothetical protein